MALLRRIGKWFGILIFSFALPLAIFNLFLVNFTGEANLKPLFSDFFANSLTSDATQDQLNAFHESILSECEQKDTVEFPILNTNATINCEEIKNSSPEQLPNLIGNAVFDNIYYREYECSFIQCLRQPCEERLFVLSSLKANQFLNTIQKILWVSTGVGLALILLSVEGWGKKLKTVGVILLYIGIPILILIFIKDYLPIKIPEFASDIVGPLLSHFFSFIFKSFLILTIIGAVLTITGYIQILSAKKTEKK